MQPHPCLTCYSLICFTAPPNPGPPTNLLASSVGSTAATISWRAPAMQANNGVSSYEIVLDEQMFNIPNVKVSVSSNRLSFGFTGLQEFDSYQLEIKSVSVFGFKSSAASITFTTMEAGEQYTVIYMCTVHIRGLDNRSPPTTPSHTHTTTHTLTYAHHNAYTHLKF